MRTNMSIRRAAALTTVAGLAVGVSTARGTIINWNNAAGGAASTAGNWSPAQVPTAADTLVYNLNSTYTVTFSGAVGLSTQHTYKRGTVTLSMSSPHTLSGNFRVGDVSGDVATTTVTTGVVTAGSVTVGSAAGSTGTLNINDSDADLTTTGSGDIVVASAGTGTMNITGGGKAAPADDFIIGGAGGDGTVNVSGFGTTPLRFSNITTTAADGDIVVGNASGSIGELNIFNSGIVGASDDVQVGPVSGSNGIVDVGGASGGGTLNIAGDLQVGNNTSSTSAGSGQVSALNGGRINVTGVIRLGDTTVGSGTLSCRDGGEINARSIICDSDGGFLNLLGGETRVDGGTLTAPGGILSIEGASGETPFLRLLNGASCSLSAPVSPFRALTIGIINDANLVVDTGSSLTVTSGDVVVGDFPAADGSLVFAGGSTGTFPAGGRITVGSNAFGHLTITGDSVVTGGSMELGAGSAGNGKLLVYASDLTLAGTLSVGGTPTFNGGVGEVRVEAASTLRVNAPGEAIRVYNGGIVLVFPGATLSALGTLSMGSGTSLTLDRGTLQALELNIGGTNPSLRGTLNGQVRFASSNIVVNPTGDLTINWPGSTTALFNLGTINVGNTTLTINGGLNRSLIGHCTIGPSGVIQGTAPLKLLASNTLSGDGTINNDIFNEGTITATGDGLTFGGIVEPAGGTMNGVRFTFADGGGFSGEGSINAKVVAQAGSKITILGDSTMGDATTAGFAIDGEIEVLGGTLTLNDANGVGLGTLTTIHGGATLTTTGPQIVLDSLPTPNTLRGFGYIEADSVINLGVVSPGLEGVNSTLALLIIGDYFMNSSGPSRGRLDIDIDATGDCDRIFLVDGNANLSGTLRLSLLDGYQPTNGESKLFVQCNTSNGSAIVGEFETLELPPRWHVSYSDKFAWLVYCAGDVNSDGFVNGDDFDSLASAFENGEPLGDFNGDGFINGDDFDQFASAFEEGC